MIKILGADFEKHGWSAYVQRSTKQDIFLYNGGKWLKIIFLT